MEVCWFQDDSLPMFIHSCRPHIDIYWLICTLWYLCRGWWMTWVHSAAHPLALNRSPGISRGYLFSCSKYESCFDKQSINGHSILWKEHIPLIIRHNKWPIITIFFVWCLSCNFQALPKSHRATRRCGVMQWLPLGRQLYSLIHISHAIRKWFGCH